MDIVHTSFKSPTTCIYAVTFRLPESSFLMSKLFLNLSVLALISMSDLLAAFSQAECPPTHALADAMCLKSSTHRRSLKLWKLFPGPPRGLGLQMGSKCVHSWATHDSHPQGALDLRGTLRNAPVNHTDLQKMSYSQKDVWIKVFKWNSRRPKVTSEEDEKGLYGRGFYPKMARSAVNEKVCKREAPGL